MMAMIGHIVRVAAMLLAANACNDGMVRLTRQLSLAATKNGAILY